MAIDDTSLQNAAIALFDDLSSNGCQQVASASVSTFQSAYNASAGGSLAVDGLYGAQSSAALQAVMNGNSSNSALANQTAPAGCVAQGGGGGGGGGNIPVVVSSGSSGVGPLPYIIGAVVIAGALAAYTYSKKKHRRH